MSLSLKISPRKLEGWEWEAKYVFVQAKTYCEQPAESVETQRKLHNNCECT